MGSAITFQQIFMDMANNQLVDFKMKETSLRYILDVLEDTENIKNYNNKERIWKALIIKI